MAENELDPPVLGISWDGTGLGTDGTAWGGEFLLARGGGFERVGHLRQFRLPGGDAAAKEPRRAALSVLYEVFGDELWDRDELLGAFPQRDILILRQMLEKNINAPLTSSAGRLFDAVAALAGLRQQASFEGQAAMELEFAIDPEITESYPFAIGEGAPRVIDWQPMILEILHEVFSGTEARFISTRFHNTLTEMMVAMARVTGEENIVLTGGCFQNHYLTERTVERLTASGFRPFWHQRVPPNDGGIALGQVIAAAWTMQNKTP
jgi:hydrogenase maturation protein HypF